ncbi:MAG: hypothetical protein MJE77_30575 [Proteobacteria bacterium]|nr:hypothetical protein [Pseudomonadota bacterium]
MDRTWSAGFRTPGRKAPFITESELERRLYRDLRDQPSDSRAHLRYLSLVHLYNAGIRASDLDLVRKGAVKLLNSLTWSHQIVIPEAIDDTATLYRIDLRGLGWTRDTWDEVVSRDPYAVARHALRWCRPDKRSQDGRRVFRARVRSRTGPRVRQTRPPVPVGDWRGHRLDSLVSSLQTRLRPGRQKLVCTSARPRQAGRLEVTFAAAVNSADHTWTNDVQTEPCVDDVRTMRRRRRRTNNLQKEYGL